MKKVTFALILLLSAQVKGQSTPSVTYQTPLTTGLTPVVVQGWTATLYVNNIPFILNDTCTSTPGIIRCTAPLPDVSSALTTTGPQNFEITFKDVILESAKSSPPFVLARPNAPSVLTIQ